ncbi:MAG: AzlD domain-containing protein [Pseudolabrys sp.]|nr:AzlD domain-containing protein [Pseudolabrys sp.]MDP2298255.1 AzlD domain-containing protein [Pseudolabrys sp.]
MIEKDPLGFLTAIAAMAIVVYLMRAGGYWLIGRVTIGPRLRRMFDALPGAIIAATVAPAMLQGGLRAVLAVGAAAAVMIVLRNDFAAVVAGVAVAAGAFALGM